MEEAVRITKKSKCSRTNQSPIVLRPFHRSDHKCFSSLCQIIYFLIILGSFSIARVLANSDSSSSSIEAALDAGNDSIVLQYLVYNAAKSLICIGGTNRLYEVDAHTLEAKGIVETGPRFDSVECRTSGCDPENPVKRLSADHINKILVLDLLLRN